MKKDGYVIIATVEFLLDKDLISEETNAEEYIKKELKDMQVKVKSGEWKNLLTGYIMGVGIAEPHKIEYEKEE